MNFKSNHVGSFSFKSTSQTFQLRFKYTIWQNNFFLLMLFVDS
jgi:hypothetical protein